MACAVRRRRNSCLAHRQRHASDKDDATAPTQRHVRVCGPSSTCVATTSDQSPLHDVKHHARDRANPFAYESFCDFGRTWLGGQTLPTPHPAQHAAAATPSRTRAKQHRNTPIWWSQTGSNRRPPACKARALPAELWPRTGIRSSEVKDQTAYCLSDDRPLIDRCPGSWWAWEDLNFRPHAYQARALTN